MDLTVDVIARDLLDTVPGIMRLIRTEMRSRRGADLSIPQFRALLFIRHNPGAGLSELAGHLGLTLPTVSKMIDRMVADYIVTRADSSTDRRRMTLVLTPQGQELLDRAHKGTRQHLSEILAGLTPAEMQTIHHSMQVLQGLFAPAAAVHAGLEK